MDGTIASLPAKSETTINKTTFVFGIGPVIIRVTADGVGKTVNGLLLGPLVILIPT